MGSAEPQSQISSRTLAGAIREVLIIPCGGLELHVCVADFADAGGVENFETMAMNTSLSTEIQPSCGCS